MLFLAGTTDTWSSDMRPITWKFDSWSDTMVTEQRALNHLVEILVTVHGVYSAERK